MLTIFLAAPAAAEAAVPATFKGWATVTPPEAQQTSAAYQWYFGYGWWKDERAAGTRIWVQPFASGWMWTWDTYRGWLAMYRTELTSEVPIVTGVKGKVTYGPLCPVEPCPTGTRQQPVELTFIKRVSTGTPIVTSVTTAADGSYSIELAPGSYIVTASVGIHWTATVTVTDEGMVTRNFAIDTGIRALGQPV